MTLTPTALTGPDFGRERSYHYCAAAKRFTEELQRLLGHVWQQALKLASATV